MARLIYAVTALALGALAAGFFIDTSNVPLFASITLSAAVMLLILFGWSRRIRKGIDLYDEADDAAVAVDEIEIAEVDDEEFRPPRTATAVLETRTPSVKPKPETTPKAKAKPKPKPTAKSKANAKAPRSATSVLVIPGRSRFHRAGCRFAKGDDLREVTEATARRRGYEPCAVCGG